MCARNPENGVQGVGGSNPLAPTNIKTKGYDYYRNPIFLFILALGTQLGTHNAICP
jgi:hypothetical protein